MALKVIIPQMENVNNLFKVYKNSNYLGVSFTQGRYGNFCQ